MKKYLVSTGLITLLLFSPKTTLGENDKSVPEVNHPHGTWTVLECRATANEDHVVQVSYGVLKFGPMFLHDPRYPYHRRIVSGSFEAKLIKLSTNEILYDGKIAVDGIAQLGTLGNGLQHHIAGSAIYDAQAKSSGSFHVDLVDRGTSLEKLKFTLPNSKTDFSGECHFYMELKPLESITGPSFDLGGPRIIEPRKDAPTWPFELLSLQLEMDIKDWKKLNYSSFRSFSAVVNESGGVSCTTRDIQQVEVRTDSRGKHIWIWLRMLWLNEIKIYLDSGDVYLYSGPPFGPNTETRLGTAIFHKKH